MIDFNGEHSVVLDYSVVIRIYRVAVVVVAVVSQLCTTVIGTVAVVIAVMVTSHNSGRRAHVP